MRLAFEVPHLETLDRLDIRDQAFPQALLDRIRLTVRLVDGWDNPHTATPGQVSDSVVPDSGALTVWAEIANPGGQLRPGLRVTVLTERLPEPGR